jgi:hypothetical protein
MKKSPVETSGDEYATEPQLDPPFIFNSFLFSGIALTMQKSASFDE